MLRDIYVKYLGLGMLLGRPVTSRDVYRVKAWLEIIESTYTMLIKSNDYGSVDKLIEDAAAHAISRLKDLTKSYNDEKRLSRSGITQTLNEIDRESSVFVKDLIERKMKQNEDETKENDKPKESEKTDTMDSVAFSSPLELTKKLNRKDETIARLRKENKELRSLVKVKTKRIKKFFDAMDDLSFNEY